MKTFKLFMAENNRQDLYHGTGADTVHDIIRSGHIQPSLNGRVSVTRNPRYATEWSKLSHKHHAVIVLNGNTVRHNNHVGPTDFDHGGGVYDKERHGMVGLEPSSGTRRSEQEESIKGPIHIKHVKEIRLHRDHYNDLIDKKPTASEQEFHHEDPHRTDPLLKGLHYEDRLKQADDFHSALKKHNIKLTLEH